MSEFSKYDDIIDSRDVIARIQELREELDLDSDGNPNEHDEEDVRPEPLDDDERDELEEELRELVEFDAQGRSYADDWDHGATIVADSHFEDYAQELAEELHGSAISEPVWPFDSIDWEDAADNLRVDYTQIEWDSYDFWVR